MDLDIQPSPRMQTDANSIRLPQKIREGLGVIVGQFIELKGKTNLVLQIKRAFDPLQTNALVSPANFECLKGSQVEFKILDVTVGCDPEFFIIHQNMVMSAATYLPFHGQIGCDGNLGELRPHYGNHETQVVNNLQGLIPTIPGQMRRSDWAKGLPKNGRHFSYEAHSYYWHFPAGFHVHLGIPPEILNTRRDFNRAAIHHLVQCLDWYVSVPLVPLEPEIRRRTNRSKYGSPGDYRSSEVTLEYRTPGAFYLRTPTLTAGLLGLCLIVTESVISKMKIATNNFSRLNLLTPGDLQEIMPIPKPEDIRGILLSPTTVRAEAQLDNIWQRLSDLPNFAKHRISVENFFRAVKEKTRPEPNLLSNWKGQP